MSAESNFIGTGQYGASEQGQKFVCPNCATEVDIRNSGSLFMGIVYSLFWSAVGLWAFIKGPLWYIQHAGYFGDEYGIKFHILDVVTIVLALVAMGFSSWAVWAFLLRPVVDHIKFPVVGETREKTPDEKKRQSKGRRNALLSLFVYPLAVWVPLLGSFWALDAVGVDIRDDGWVQYVALFALLGLIYSLSRRIGVNAYFVFVGMVIWLAAFVALVFAL
jgi:hypothetical protein